jgi:membrane fusion protein, multidrug efflux system
VFPNPDNILRPGLYGKVRAVTDTAHNALLVPQDALLQTQGQYQVAVVDAENKVSMRNVTIGPPVGAFQIIQTGISAGDHVVTDGLQKVRDGMEVDPQLVAVQGPDQTIPGAAAPAASPSAASSTQN